MAHSADICRANGWVPGTILMGDEGYGPTVIEITAVGRRQVLALRISQDGKPSKYFDECMWSLDHRDWKIVAAQPTS